ncbi:MAG: hypothetical protein UIC64_04495 [Agathobacter sp.]|nr:hypothetical protein [Agathobacter sp.]
MKRVKVGICREKKKYIPTPHHSGEVKRAKVGICRKIEEKYPGEKLAGGISQELKGIYPSKSQESKKIAENRRFSRVIKYVLGY